MDPVQNVNDLTGKSLQAMKADEIPTDNNLSPLLFQGQPSSKEEEVGRSNDDDHFESFNQALDTINLDDLSQDELRDLRNKLLKFHEKLVEQAEVLRGKGKARAN